MIDNFNQIDSNQLQFHLIDKAGLSGQTPQDRSQVGQA